MKKLFTMIAMVAFLAACGGNPNKQAKAAEAETAAVENTEACCKEEGECCKAEGECTEGEKACCDAATEEVAVTEETAAAAE